MRIVPLLSLLCLAACSGRGGAGNEATVDVDAAANRAQRDIANYAAGTPAPPVSAPAPAPLPSLSPAPTASPIAAATAAADPEPTEGVVSVPLAQRAPGAAADVVRAYVAALSQGRYRAAWKLWGGAGEASRMSAAAFAASFDKYASITGEVGAPYDGDAGAGNLFLTVPLILRGTLKSGGPFVLRGPIVLHRVNDGIRTPDPVDHLWRIKSSGLKPRPEGSDGSAPRRPEVAR